MSLAKGEKLYEYPKNGPFKLRKTLYATFDRHHYSIEFAVTGVILQAIRTVPAMPTAEPVALGSLKLIFTDTFDYRWNDTAAVAISSRHQRS